MAESKTKSSTPVKPASTATGAKPKLKSAKPEADQSVVKRASIAKPKATTVQQADSGTKKTAAKRSVKAFNNPISAELRYRMIAEAAYYIAQQRGFAAGDAGADWAQAEAQIAQLLDQK